MRVKSADSTWQSSDTSQLKLRPVLLNSIRELTCSNLPSLTLATSTHHFLVKRINQYGCQNSSQLPRKHDERRVNCKYMLKPATFQLHAANSFIGHHPQLKPLTDVASRPSPSFACGVHIIIIYIYIDIHICLHPTNLVDTATVLMIKCSSRDTCNPSFFLFFF